MSWHFSRALVAEYLAATSSDGEPFAPSNGSPTPQLYLQPDRMTAFSRLSRSGMTCAPLTEDHGEDLLTWFLAASRARTSAPQDAAPASRASGRDYGPKWQELSVKYSPDSSCWKTHHCLWAEDLPWSSVILPKWGSMRNGLVYQHPTLERPISGIGSGSPPWQTVVADDAIERAAGKWNSRGEPRLSAQVKLWPTPTACASKGTPPGSLIRKTGASRERDRLDHAVMASDHGQLNPEWVEWLMGWPIGWTGLKPLGMDKFREWQRQHSPSCTTFEDAAA
ncbi:hypothetical protein LQD23_16235 [Chromobacterium violaceum]|nr:hypothetical protein [Chromobacterium violaceum]MCD0493830.1 hypothetical protein [Chromobacterium violaceum]